MSAWYARRRSLVLRFAVVAEEVVDETANVEAVAAVRAVREATRYLESSSDDLESARAAAAAALKAAGLETTMRARLRFATPGKHELVHHILPNLWAGGWSALNDGCRSLKLRRVRYVLSITTATRRLPFVHLQIECPDEPTAPLHQHFAAICWFLDAARKRGRAYAHCGAGVSRTGACLVAYVVWRFRLTVDEALVVVRAGRPKIRPNGGFMRQLAAWEARVRASPKRLSLEDELPRDTADQLAFWAAFQDDDDDGFCGGKGEGDHQARQLVLAPDNKNRRRRDQKCCSKK
ncbi:hypothetical protein CTAYLR_000013 [Chrysophaeum taylorii]|uniref:Protein-tyrosine-phosphatase n=1 Tax=Chrysophaeum taylorii TaxID=2483200 RepID=A0AAD7UH68_9STRA|nr:hypothetical protein CTAYLR_000013 [Chrysophaeum taylorii]